MNSASVGSLNVYVGKIFPAVRTVRILAVIDAPDASNSGHNEQIVRQAALMAERAGGELHVASAYSALPSNADAYRVERYLPALRVKARDRQRSAIRQLLRRLKIDNALIHVEEGESPQVIDALAASLQAVVVDGTSIRVDASAVTIERTGLPEHFAA